MQEKLNVPAKLKVGFNKRNDTYTKKLAFVVYVKKNGDVSSTKSWNRWKDDKIPVEEYDNEPIQGFVLNRDVGGTQRSWSWNARREKVRVFDPRGFEIEITVDNLLFILQECSSIKGKGLEGEFVYGWSGSQIVLLPIESKEYKKSVEFTSLQTKKVTRKDMVEGCSYMTKQNEEVMYLGRHAWYELKYWGSQYHTRSFGGKKKHIFLLLETKEKGRYRYHVESGFTKLATRTSETPLDNYAEEYEKLKNSKYTSVPKKLVFRKVPPKKYNDPYSKGRTYHHYYYDLCRNNNGEYELGRYNADEEKFYPIRRIEIKDGEYVETSIRSKYQVKSTSRWGGYESYDDKPVSLKREEIGVLFVEMENGKRENISRKY